MILELRRLLAKHALLLLFIFAAAVSLICILSQSGQVSAWPMDQSFVTRADLRISYLPSGWVFQYPRFSWSGGVSASLMVGLYKLIFSPPAETLNWHAKGLATILFLSSSLSLCLLLIRGWLFQALAFLVIASSGLQFAEPSSDIMAASFFGFFLVSVRLGWPRLVSSGLLMFFGLSKIQLLTCSLGLGVLWYWWDFKVNRMRWQIPAFMSLWFFLLMAPGFKLYGIDMIRTEKGLRTFVTSYMLLFSPHQFIVRPGSLADGMPDWREVMRLVFPGVKTMAGLVLTYPGKYFDFLLVSGSRSLYVIFQAMGLMLLPFFQAMRLRAFQDKERLTMRFLGAAALFTLLPPMLLRFMSPRYLAIIFLPIVALSAAAAGDPRAPRRLKIVFIACALLSLIINILLFRDRLVESPFMPLG